MRKRLKHVSELPNWFKLEKYIGAIKLTTRGWYTQLAVRKCYLEYMSLGHLQEPISIIRNKPIVSIDDHDIFPCWFIAACKVDINPYCPSDTSLGVNSLTMFEYFEMQKKIRSCVKITCLSCNDYLVGFIV